MKTMFYLYIFGVILALTGMIYQCLEIYRYKDYFHIVKSDKKVKTSAQVNAWVRLIIRILYACGIPGLNILYGFIYHTLSDYKFEEIAYDAVTKSLDSGNLCFDAEYGDPEQLKYVFKTTHAYRMVKFRLK